MPPPRTFTEALTVTTEDTPDARHLAALAAAVNDRLLSGLGDGTQRLGYYWFGGALRSVRMPSGELAPPEAEYHKEYQNREPGDGDWPVAGPDDPEGANTANPAMAYLFGNATIDLLDEQSRLASVPTDLGVGVELTPWNLWLLSEQQRGAFVAATGEVACPAFTVAQSYARIRQDPRSPHGFAWGGMVAHPSLVSGTFCTAEPDGFRAPNFAVFFTRLSDNFVLEYPGTCPEEPTHIAFIIYPPNRYSTVPAYYVVLNNGQVDVLPEAEWIEGPYTGNARLAKTQADILSRVQAEHAAELKGTAEQQLAADGGAAEAFQTEEFGQRQYALAPQSGEMVGDVIVPRYPEWAVSSASAGTALVAGGSLPFTTTGGGGGTSHTWPAGTVCHGLAATAEGLAGPVTLQLRDNGTVFASLTLTPDEEGHAEARLMLPAARPALTAATVTTVNAIVLGAGGGGVRLRTSSLYAYKPQKHDLFFVARRAVWNGSVTALDGRGIDCATARAISDTLADEGVILSQGMADGFSPPLTTQPVNLNGFMDTLRRLSQMVRLVPRQQFTGISLEDGDTVLTFTRTGSSDDNDMFTGIGPSRTAIASGGLVWGRTYRVESGTVTYQEVAYTAAQEFTAVEGAATFTGEGVVREIDGIRAVAEPQGFTNRWALDVRTMPYRDNEASIWKPDNYADIRSPFIDRCHVWSQEVQGDSNAHRHFAFSGSHAEPVLYPEGMTGYRFIPTQGDAPGGTFATGTTNGTVCPEDDEDCLARRTQFQRSCRVYEPAREVKSATRYLVGDVEHIRLVLDGRLHHHADAPSSFSADRGTWTGGALTDLQTRLAQSVTAEDALRAYLLNQDSGLNIAATGEGNSAFYSGLNLELDKPWLSCYPWFQLTELVPSPYLDEDSEYQVHDTAMLSATLRRVDMVVRGICEGYVDGRTTAARACAGTSFSTFIHTYANLMLEANGNRWPRWFSAADRPDNPYGHGPMPGQLRLADHLNDLARALNLLRDVPLWLPNVFERRLSTVTADVAVIAAVGPCGVAEDCSEDTGGHFAVASVGQVLPAVTTTGDWEIVGNGGGFGLNGSLTLGDGGGNCSGTGWRVVAHNETAEFRWRLMSGAEEALPEGVADLLAEGPVAVFTKTYQTSRWDGPRYVEEAEASTHYEGNPGNAFCAGVGYAVLDETIAIPPGECELSPEVALPALPGGKLGHFSTGGGFPQDFTASYGPEVFATVTFHTDGAAILRVPLVAYGGGS
jgi:hypothetical protein